MTERMPATKHKHRRSKTVRKRESQLKILKLTPTQWLGVLFMIFGVFVMLYGIVLIPQSGVSIGPISVTDIPGRSAAAIGIGAFIVLVGLVLVSGRVHIGDLTFD
jgi:hypothetical protein